MASRPYAQISCTLPASKKMRQLRNNESRWAYICAHLSLLGNYTGMFRYPVSVWAEDTALSPSELEACISDLVEFDLIEFDSDEQVVRIIAWFHKKNCPENASRMIGLIGDYRVVDGVGTGMYSRSVSEFIVGSIRRAQSWNPNSSDWSKLRESFQPFLRQTYQTHGEQFLNTLAAEVLASGKSVRAEICSLFPLCGDAILALEPTRCSHPVATLSPHKTTLHDTKTKLKQDYTEQNQSEDEKSMLAHEQPTLELLRTDAMELSDSATTMPCEDTKRSKLALEAIGARESST